MIWEVKLGNTFDVPHDIKPKTLIDCVSQRQYKQSAVMFQDETFGVIIVYNKCGDHLIWEHNASKSASDVHIVMYTHAGLLEAC